MLLKDEAATSKTIDKDGWLDTGDLGWIAPDVTIGAGRRCGGVLVLDGRAKDTIVLLNGTALPSHRITQKYDNNHIIDLQFDRSLT